MKLLLLIVLSTIMLSNRVHAGVVGDLIQKVFGGSGDESSQVEEMLAHQRSQMAQEAKSRADWENVITQLKSAGFCVSYNKYLRDEFYQATKYMGSQCASREKPDEKCYYAFLDATRYFVKDGMGNALQDKEFKSFQDFASHLPANLKVVVDFERTVGKAKLSDYHCEEFVEPVGGD